MSKFVSRDQAEDEASEAYSRGFQRGFDLAQEKALDLIDKLSQIEDIPKFQEIYKAILLLSP